MISLRHSSSNNAVSWHANKSAGACHGSWVRTAQATYLPLQAGLVIVLCFNVVAVFNIRAQVRRNNEYLRQRRWLLVLVLGDFKIHRGAQREPQNLPYFFSGLQLIGLTVGLAVSLQ